MTRGPIVADMQRFIASLVVAAWALWFGGVITLFLAVVSLFRTFAADRAMAGTAAAGVFHAFDRYQLVLAAVLLPLAVVWRLYRGATRLKTALFGLFALATVLAVTSAAAVTPRIEALRRQGDTASARFKSLHGVSSTLYLSQAILLLAGGFVLTAAVARDGSPRRAGAGDFQTADRETVTA